MYVCYEYWIAHNHYPTTILSIYERKRRHGIMGEHQEAHVQLHSLKSFPLSLPASLQECTLCRHSTRLSLSARLTRDAAGYGLHLYKLAHSASFMDSPANDTATLPL